MSEFETTRTDDEAFEKWLEQDSMKCTESILSIDRQNWIKFVGGALARRAWQAAKADSEQEIAKLKAANEWLKTNPRTDTVEWYENKINSLELYINELIERCAKIAENHWDVDSAAAIRKLKV